MSLNPYSPPGAALDLPPEVNRPKGGFPFLLVMRWLVAALVLGYGVVRLMDLTQAWTWLADATIVDPSYSPYRGLFGDGCVVLTGILLALRSKYVFIPLFGHIGMLLWYAFGSGFPREIPGVLFLGWAGQSAVLGFCMLLLIKQRLR